MTENPSKKRIFSGIQPTGTFTLGNYLGAIKNWGVLQNECDCTYSVVDMHAITIKQDPKAFREQTLSCFALLLACGLDPEKSTIFIQSHVPCHAQLTWALSCSTQFGELSRMTQFKDKSLRHSDNINSGLFLYPVLMAADILLYQADFVPVGADQRQHIELARNIAVRFNGTYGDTFTMPEMYSNKLTAKVMSLTEPTKKMSKSEDNANSYVTILDQPSTIIKKFKRAVTDSDALVAYREGKDGINNLMSIYSAITGQSFEQIEHDFASKGYGDFKVAVGEAVAAELTPIREEHTRLMQDKAYLTEVYTKGAQRAQYIAEKTLKKVYKKIGFIL